MPQQASWLGRMLPPRYGEGVGVQHTKLYAFDDTVILTGANLSHDYFTSRQDRYVVIRNAGPLAAFVHGVVQQMVAVSHTVLPSGNSGKSVAIAAPAARDDKHDAFAAWLRQQFRCQTADDVAVRQAISAQRNTDAGRHG